MAVENVVHAAFFHPPHLMKNHPLTRAVIAGIFALAVTIANAQADRAAIVQRIAVAQGLTELFEQQIGQSREAAQAYAVKMFDQAVASTGKEPNAREKAALQRLIAKSAEIFSGAELVAAWTRHYGKDLSLEELTGILNYYESPLGRKDVMATKAAMPAYTSWATEEAQARSLIIIQQFTADLQAARP